MADDSFQPYSFFELSELDPAFRADPHSRLDAMRTRCPVHHDAPLGQVRITAHAPAREILYDTSLSRDLSRARPDNPVRMFMEADDAAIAARLTAELGVDVAARSNASILFSEDPDHGRIRGILLKRFQERVARFRPQVEAVVDAALDDLAGQPQFDLIAGYAEIIPVNVIAALLGVTVSDTAQFRHWSSDLLAVFNPMASQAQRAARMDAVVGLMKLIHGLIRHAAANPGDDFISDILRDRAAGAAITDAELADNLLTLLVAGHLTTTDLIGNGVWLLLTHPQERRRLAEDPTLIASAVEEILRYEPPTPITSRFVVAPRPLGACIAEPREAFLVSKVGS